MYIQPLTPLVVPVDLGPVPRGQPVKARPDQRGEASAAAIETSHVDRQDSVEISQEAEAELAGQLSIEARRVVQRMKATDRKIRAHEQAHVSAAGAYARGGPSFSYQTGPDGMKYAVGGEVSIDTSTIPGDPEATIRKAQVIRAAALAPANPSGQDRSVAAAASKMEAHARQELRKKQTVQEQDEQPGEEYGDKPSSVDRAAVGSLFDAIA